LLKGLAHGIDSCGSAHAIRQRGDSPWEVLALARPEVRGNLLGMGRTTGIRGDL